MKTFERHPIRRHGLGSAAGWLGVALLALLLGGCASERFARPETGSRQRGMASWYGPQFHGKPTASGVIYDMHGLSAAHKQLPLGTEIEVVNLDNGRRVNVQINDRGPFVRGRILDLSLGAAKKLGMVEAGLARVEIRVLRVGSGRPGDLYAAAFAVQVGAFRQVDNARRTLASVRRHHPRAEIVRDGELHRVRVGTFGERAAAEALRGELRRRGFDSIIVPIPRR